MFWTIFFSFVDRYYRGEDLPTAGSQKSTEQLCGGWRGGCWKAFLSWRVKRPLSFEWGHNQRHSWQVSTCAFYVLKMVLSSTILQNVWAEVFQDHQWQMQCVQYQRTIDNPRWTVAATVYKLLNGCRLMQSCTFLVSKPEIPTPIALSTRRSKS